MDLQRIGRGLDRVWLEEERCRNGMDRAEVRCLPLPLQLPPSLPLPLPLADPLTSSSSEWLEKLLPVGLGGGEDME